MDLKIGFIGVGNMGSALIKGLVKSQIVPAGNINIYDIDQVKLNSLKNETGVKVLNDACEVAKASDIIILAVKPNTVKSVIKSIREYININKILVSIAVGLPISLFKDILGEESKIVRTMPNTPAMVGEGMTLISKDENITEQDIEIVKKIFQCTGKVEEIDEKLMNEVTALTGSSPAYVFIFIEAMADAAVQSGIPRALAYRLAAQAVLGSAKMVLEAGKHPAELKDQVCSPAGTTIEAVAALEKYGFRNAVIEAMKECTRRAKEIGS